MTPREPSDPSPHHGHDPQPRGSPEPEALHELEALLNQTRPDPIDDDRLARILDKVEALRRPWKNDGSSPQDPFATLLTSKPTLRPIPSADDQPADLDQLLDETDPPPLPEQRVEKILRAVLEQIHQPSGPAQGESIHGDDLEEDNPEDVVDNHDTRMMRNALVGTLAYVAPEQRTEILAEIHRRASNPQPPQGPPPRAPWPWLARHRHGLGVAATIAVLLPLAVFMLMPSPQPAARINLDPSTQTGTPLSVDPHRGSQVDSTQQPSTISFNFASNATNQPATAHGQLDWDLATRSGRFTAAGLLASKPGRAYHVWLHPRDGQPVSLAQFTVTGPDQQIHLSLSSPSDPPTVPSTPMLMTVTQQPTDTLPDPSAPVHLLGRPSPQTQIPSEGTK